MRDDLDELRLDKRVRRPAALFFAVRPLRFEALAILDTEVQRQRLPLCPLNADLVDSVGFAAEVSAPILGLYRGSFTPRDADTACRMSPAAAEGSSAQRAKVLWRNTQPLASILLFCLACKSLYFCRACNAGAKHETARVPIPTPDALW